MQRNESAAWGQTHRGAGRHPPSFSNSSPGSSADVDCRWQLPSGEAEGIPWGSVCWTAERDWWLLF